MSESIVLEVLPLALGTAVSPLVVAGEIYWITDPGAGLRRGWLFAGGNAVVVAIWLLIAITMGHLLPVRSHGPDGISAAFRLVMGLVMFVLGIQLLLHPPGRQQVTTPPVSGNRNLRAFALGLGVMGQNISSLLLFFPAVTDFSRVQDANAVRVFLLAALVLATLSPCLFPPLLVGLGGRRGQALLDRFDRWLKPKQWAFGLAVFFGMGTYLWLSAFSIL